MVASACSRRILPTSHSSTLFCRSFRTVSPNFLPWLTGSGFASLLFAGLLPFAIKGSALDHHHLEQWFQPPGSLLRTAFCTAGTLSATSVRDLFVSQPGP